MESYPLDPNYSTFEFFYDTSFKDYAVVEEYGITVKVGTYTVRAEWTVEMLDELRQMQPIDVRAELEIALEQQLNQRFTSAQIPIIARMINDRIF